MLHLGIASTHLCISMACCSSVHVTKNKLAKPSMPSSLLSLLFFFLLLPTNSLTGHLLLPPSLVSSLSPSQPQEYLDPTFPSFVLPSAPPSCSLHLFSHSFAYTYGLPPVSALYSPPPLCPPPLWSNIILRLSVSAAGDQYDRIAAVWLDGIELLRTSTAEPTDSGVYWSVRKDITRYSSLLEQPLNRTLYMMLENIVDESLTGVYHVNVSFDFYLQKEEEEELGLNYIISQGGSKPADLIIPISESEEKSDSGFWFRIENESDLRFTRVSIPTNTYRAVLEIYASSHGNDEFWYSNPPDSYIEKNNLTTKRGNGAFREVFATVDGRFSGSVVPFPVVFTGGINPLFWSPVVGLGAFDLPSYYLELTPFLELLLDGKSHELGLGVTDGISFWLIDANLHLWLDPNSDCTKAKLVHYYSQNISISREYSFESLNGLFKIEAERKSHFSGWVSSSFGNLTTDLNQNFEFKNSVEFTNNGNNKDASTTTKQKKMVKVKSDRNEVSKEEFLVTKYPIRFVSKTLQGENNTYTSVTNLSHALYIETCLRFGKVLVSKSLIDRQKADGWMLVRDHSVLSGSAGTEQAYEYLDEDMIYRRAISAKDSVILSDNSTQSFSLLSSSQ